jgi:hypothetical protein
MQTSSTSTRSLLSMRSLVTTDSPHIRLMARTSLLVPSVDLKGECGLVKRQLCPDPSLGTSVLFCCRPCGSLARSSPWVEELRLAAGPIGPSLDARPTIITATPTTGALSFLDCVDAGFFGNLGRVALSQYTIDRCDAHRLHGMSFGHVAIVIRG